MACALPIDVEQHIEAGRQLSLHGFAAGSVSVIKNAGVFEKRMILNPCRESCLVDKVIMHPVPFARARRARRVGH